MKLTIEWIEQKLDGPYGLDTLEEIALLKAMRAVLEIENRDEGPVTRLMRRYVIPAAREAFATAINSEETKP